MFNSIHAPEWGATNAVYRCGFLRLVSIRRRLPDSYIIQTPAPDSKCGRLLIYLRDLCAALHSHFLHDREIDFDELLVVRDHINFVELVALGFESSPDSCVKCYTMFLPFLLIKIDVFS